MRKLRLSALIAGVSSLTVMVAYLITQYNYPIYFTEPIPLIRNFEIGWGLLSIPFLFRMIAEECGFK